MMLYIGTKTKHLHNILTEQIFFHLNNMFSIYPFIVIVIIKSCVTYECGRDSYVRLQMISWFFVHWFLALYIEFTLFNPKRFGTQFGIVTTFSGYLIYEFAMNCGLILNHSRLKSDLVSNLYTPWALIIIGPNKRAQYSWRTIQVYL